jgi:multidrug resistance efflux pump
MGRGTNTTVEAALNQVEAASAMQDIASANLSSAQNGARSEQIRAAQAQVSSATAQLAAAKARNAAAQSQAEAAKAQVDMAQAAVNILDVQISKLTITAPADGVVMTTIIQPGEIAAPGATLLVLGRMEDKTITVFISEESYGRISIGEAAQVSVDSFPREVFEAHVIHIADKAEFTPRNVQTAEGRKNTVFAIKLNVDDPNGKLKAGMPADVIFK